MRILYLHLYIYVAVCWCCITKLKVSAIDRSVFVLPLSVTANCTHQYSASHLQVHCGFALNQDAGLSAQWAGSVVLSSPPPAPTQSLCGF